MPVIENEPIMWSGHKPVLFAKGVTLVKRFCKLNNISVPEIQAIQKSEWYVGACAFYRPTYIHICLEHCGSPCGETNSRNWTWPCSTTDREPYGVLAHELGHHCDYLASDKRGAYLCDYGKGIMEATKEKPITSYAPNHAEWFAEMFRLFVTNPLLLQQLRPKTYKALVAKWKHLPHKNWLEPLGENVPDRVIKTLIRKGAKSAHQDKEHQHCVQGTRYPVSFA